MTTSLAEELRRIRGIRSASLRQVEKATGISNAYLSQLEHGDATNPSPNILYKLAEFYNVPYESLMTAAGYLKTSERASGKRPSGIQAALMTADLTDEESKVVAEYIEFVRSQRKRRTK
jgi:HTH-type transcriptional regulator, competence development regulator